MQTWLNVNREILNRTLATETEREREKSELDLLVKNDFSAHFFIEGLSLEGRHREVEGKEKRGRLLLRHGGRGE